MIIAGEHSSFVCHIHNLPLLSRPSSSELLRLYSDNRFPHYIYFCGYDLLERGDTSICQAFYCFEEPSIRSYALDDIDSIFEYSFHLSDKYSVFWDQDQMHLIKDCDDGSFDVLAGVDSEPFRIRSYNLKEHITSIRNRFEKLIALE